MAKAPVADQHRLLEVQALDTRIAQAQHRKQHLPVRVDVEQTQSLLAEVTDRKVEAATTVADIRREVTKAEDDVQSVRARAERDNARLNSGAGMTPRDLQALQGELEALAKRQGDLEDVELDALQRLEDADAIAAQADEEHSRLSAQIQDLNAILISEEAGIDDEVAALVTERAQRAAGLDESLLALYEKLRAAQGGVGAAELTRGQCLGCNMSLNPVDLAKIESSPADDVIRCEECGRILVRGVGR